MHGGGEVGGGIRFQFSGSPAGAPRSQNRIVELDFSWTTDNQLVRLDINWAALRRKPPLNGLLQAKIYGAFNSDGHGKPEQLAACPSEVQIEGLQRAKREGLRLISTFIRICWPLILISLSHTSDYEATHTWGYENMILIFIK